MSVENNGDFVPGERRRRLWTRDENRRIVEESLQDGASIAEVARRHELNANLLFTWRAPAQTKGLEVAAKLAVARAKASEDKALIAQQKLRIAKFEY